MNKSRDEFRARTSTLKATEWDAGYDVVHKKAIELAEIDLDNDSILTQVFVVVEKRTVVERVS